MDKGVHYIYNGCYTATIDDNEGRQQWTCVMCVRDHDSVEKASLLLSNDASDSNCQALRVMVEKLAPAFAPLLEEAELKRYFGRRTFRGALVRCNRLNHGEWVVLLGDAAHSVLPPTGEGVNSGLEDAYILVSNVSSGSVFEEFNQARLGNVHALHSYASYLNGSPWFSGEKAARLIMTIVEASLSGGKDGSNIGSMLFGPKSTERIPYGQIVSAWNAKAWVILPLARLLTYPIAAAFQLAWLPFSLILRLFNSTKNNKVNVKVDTTTLKPPV